MPQRPATINNDMIFTFISTGMYPELVSIMTTLVNWRDLQGLPEDLYQFHRILDKNHRKLPQISYPSQEKIKRLINQQKAAKSGRI